MNDLEFHKLIFLFLLKRNDYKSDSYSIIRTLTRRFNVYNFVEIIDLLLSEEFIRRTNTNNIEGFELINTGNELVTANQIKLKQKMYDFFPEQRDFLDILFKPDSSGM